MWVEFFVGSLLVPRDVRVVPSPLLKTNISKIQIDLIGGACRVSGTLVFSCCEVGRAATRDQFDNLLFCYNCFQVLQNLANHVLFTKEKHMEPFNGFLQANFDKARK